MAVGNFVEIVGNVTGDIEYKVTPSGTAVAKFGVAWNRRWQQDGEWQEEAHFFDVTAWKELADNVANSLNKGDRVTVTGRLNLDRWEDKNTGDKRSKVAIIADEVSVSLRWAEVSIKKNEREGGFDRGGRGGGGRGRDSYDEPRGGGREAPRGRSYDDEVPF